MSFDPEAFRTSQNAKFRAQYDSAIASRGYAITTTSSRITHAADRIVTNPNGFLMPRARCQASTTRQYHGITGDQTLPVTCQRCLASLAKKGA